MNAKRRVGVMGGTFDPVHHGHLVAASEVSNTFGLDEVIFVPTGIHQSERNRPARSLAARFAAKEALIKALGGHAVIRWHDMQIVQDADGNPDFVLSGALAAHVTSLGIERVHLSMSHDAGIASAFVVLEKGAR